MHQVAACVDQPCDLFLAEHCRKTLGMLGKRERIRQVRPPQCLDEQEPQRRRLSRDGASRKPAVAEQMDLVLADVIGSKLLGRTTEVPGELLHCTQVRPYGVRRVVTTLEFVEHQLAKMGHRKSSL